VTGVSKSRSLVETYWSSLGLVYHNIIDRTAALYLRKNHIRVVTNESDQQEALAHWRIEYIFAQKCFLAIKRCGKESSGVNLSWNEYTGESERNWTWLLKYRESKNNLLITSYPYIYHWGLFQNHEWQMIRNTIASLFVDVKMEPIFDLSSSIIQTGAPYRWKSQAQRGLSLMRKCRLPWAGVKPGLDHSKWLIVLSFPHSDSSLKLWKIILPLWLFISFVEFYKNKI